MISTEAAIANLARYVDPAFVSRLGMGVREADAYRLPERFGPVEGTRRIVKELYQQFSERHLYYAAHAFRIGATDPLSQEPLRQWIRPPDDTNRFAGNCLDLATFFASVCLAHRVAPIILVGFQGGYGHAWVMCDLARAPKGSDDRLADPPNDSVWATALPHGTRGCVGLDSTLVNKLLADDRYLSVDITQAAKGQDPGAEFEEAVKSATEWAVGSLPLFAVDVARALGRFAEYGLVPYDLPAEMPAIRCQLSDTGPFVPYPERTGDVERLMAAQGISAVVGEPGMGKSTLALRSVWRSTRSSTAWFLPASSTVALRQSLGRCEAREAMGTDADLSSVQLERLASDAQERLINSSLPWLLLVDNANLTESASVKEALQLLAEVPKPNPSFGQAVILTSTNAALWEEVLGVDAVITLLPLEHSESDLPVPQTLRSVPLFATACRRMLETIGDITAFTAAADELTSEIEAGEALWRLAKRLFGIDHPGIVAALVGAWGAPENLDLLLMLEIAGIPLTSAQAASTGLLEVIGPGTAKMHRLIGRAIRTWSLTHDTEHCLARIEDLVETNFQLDTETYEESLDALVSSEIPRNLRPQLGRILHALGTRMEPSLGAATADRAMQAALDDLPHWDHRRRADCQHSRARCIFQSPKNTEGHRIEDGLRIAEECLELRQRAFAEPMLQLDRLILEVERQRTIALRGLIRVKMSVATLRGLKQRAAELTTDERSHYDEALGLAREGNDEINSSLAIRTELLNDPDDPDLIRGAFNQASSAAQLAQFAESAVEECGLLNVAEQRYERCREARERMTPALPMAHIASCYSGLGLIDYLRAISPCSDIEAQDRLALLRTAARRVQESLVMRESYERIDGGDVAKSTRLEFKIALARWMLTQRPEALSSVTRDLRREVIQELPTLSELWGD
jgi:hypothetical protein